MVFAEISSERAFFRLPALNVLGIPPFHAEVVELVDTLGSGSSEGSFMGVRVSPSAPVESPQKSRKVQKALRDLAFWAMGSPTRCREIQGQRTKKTVFMAVSPVGASFPFQKYRHLLTL